MKRLGRTPRGFYSFSTCQHHGRVFSFRPEAGTLRVTEILLGPEPRYPEVDTGIHTGQVDEWEMGCCSLDDCVPVAFGKSQSPSPLSPQTVQARYVPVPSDVRWGRGPFLCPGLDSYVLICFGRGKTAILWDRDPPAGHPLRLPPRYRRPAAFGP